VLLDDGQRPDPASSSRATATFATTGFLRRAVNASQRLCSRWLPRWPRTCAAAGACPQRVRRDRAQEGADRGPAEPRPVPDLRGPTEPGQGGDPRAGQPSRWTNIGKVRRDLPGRQPAGVEADHDLVDPTQPALALLHQLRLERAVAVARDVDVDLAATVGQHRLRPLPVAGVGPVPSRDGVLVVAEVVDHLSSARPRHRLRHRLQTTCPDRSARSPHSGPVHQVLDRGQLGRTQRPVFSVVSGSRRLRWRAHAHQCVGHQMTPSPPIRAVRPLTPFLRQSRCWRRRAQGSTG